MRRPKSLKVTSDSSHSSHSSHLYCVPHWDLFNDLLWSKSTIRVKAITFSKEPLLKGMAQYSWPPCIQ